VSKLPPNVGPKQSARTTSKIGPVSLDPTKAQRAAPADTTGDAEHRSFVDTFFTQVPKPGEDTPIVYNGDRLWAKVTLTLETAGPVVVGNQSSLAPVLSGKGQLLETDEPVVFYIAKGTRLYILSTGINRVKRVIEPVPWLETITGLLGSLMKQAGGGVISAIRSKF